MPLLIALLGVLLAQQAAAPPPLDYDVFKTRIQPIFLKERRPDEGAGAACVSCHSRVASRMRLQALADGATTYTEAQSRQNFEVVSKLIVAGDPVHSPLLLHPLAQAAGGDAAHTGGKFWTSQDNPEWQAIAAWVRAASPASVAATPAVVLDFAFFRDRVQPIFLKKRPGNARCIVCHENGNPRLQSLPEGAASWTEEQSRMNFEAWKRVVVPGDPTASRMLMHPLAPAAGGDPFHAGGKHWTSQSDPEWQTLAAWVKGAKGAPASN
jgi:hypothetical protein